MKIYAIVPARSGSKGVKDKNVKKLAGLPLMAYSIRFAKKLGVDKVLCSTNSKQYAKIAIEHGAEVPFLRSEEPASDTAMEHHILEDLYNKFIKHNIALPDLLVWLRPTFVFRDRNAIIEAINVLKSDQQYSAARTIVETEGRLYKLSNSTLLPDFNDRGKSMIRRQDIGHFYKVYSTDVFRFSKDNLNDAFLGENICGIPVSKICGLDIDDEIDFKLVEALIENARYLVDEYLY